MVRIYSHQCGVVSARRGQAKWLIVSFAICRSAPLFFRADKTNSVDELMKGTPLFLRADKTNSVDDLMKGNGTMPTAYQEMKEESCEAHFPYFLQNFELMAQM